MILNLGLVVREISCSNPYCLKGLAAHGSALLQDLSRHAGLVLACSAGYDREQASLRVHATKELTAKVVASRKTTTSGLRSGCSERLSKLEKRLWGSLDSLINDVREAEEEREKMGKRMRDKLEGVKGRVREEIEAEKQKRGEAQEKMMHVLGNLVELSGRLE